MPADELEQFIAQATRNFLASPGGRDLVADASADTFRRLQCLADADLSETLELLGNAQIRDGSALLSLDANALAFKLTIEKSNVKLNQLTFDVPFIRKRRGVETRLVMSGPSAKKVDNALAGNIARAHAWLERVKRGESFEEIATTENTSKRRVQQTLECAFLAPDIVRDILAGKQPPGLTSTWIARHTVPTDWAEQRALIATL